MSEVYEFIDESHKRDENSLTVDFFFNSDVPKEMAIECIEKIISDAKREDNLIQGYRTTIYAKSPFSYGD